MDKKIKRECFRNTEIYPYGEYVECMNCFRWFKLIREHRKLYCKSKCTDCLLDK